MKNNVISLFKHCVNTYPDFTAVRQESQQHYTYNELDLLSKQINQELNILSVESKVVATYMSSGANLIASMLAIFESRGIYLPMDINFSKKRLGQIFTNTFSGIIITEMGRLDDLRSILVELEVNWEIIVTVDIDGKVSTHSNDNYLPASVSYYKVENDSDYDAAYIYYTSGSTGEGKAILGSHQSLYQYINWEIEEFEIREQTRISQIAPITFDASLKDILPAICSGGTVCIPNPDTKENDVLLTKWIDQEQINILQCVPSYFRLIIKSLKQNNISVKDLKHLTNVLLAGEMLYARDMMAWNELGGGHVEITNLYGATESTILKTFNRVKSIPEHPADIIHIGKPITEAAVAIINDGKLCSVGEKGEIFIRSKYLTRGYVNNEQLNAQTFIQNPLIKDKADIVYKTGDIGRYTKDGNIEIIGRLDQQVKINGIRVELGEIEAAVLHHPEIEQAVVVANKGTDNDLNLVCYYAPKNVSQEAIAQKIRLALNDGMLPAYFVGLDQFPLNSNGKINRKLLPKPEALILNDADYKAPETPTELVLETIWQDVLGLNKIGKDRSFFQIGGQSLKAIQINSRIFRELGVNVHITNIFEYPTIEQLGKFIDACQPAVYEKIPEAPEQEMYLVSPSQRRLWMLGQFSENSAAYHMHGGYTFEGEIQIDALQSAFKELIDRHEILRTTFHNTDGKVFQKVSSCTAINFDITVDDIRGEDHIDNQLQKISRAHAGAPFDLENGPLFRVALVRIKEDKYVYMITIHHIIADDWSMEILAKEISILYNFYAKGQHKSLNPLSIHYKDYTHWLNTKINSQSINSDQKYWLNEFEGEIPVLDLPTTYSRPAIKTYNGDSVRLTLNEANTLLLRNLSEKKDCTLFMSILAAFNAVLYKYTGQNDIVLGSPVSGRNHSDLENQIGFFINMLALRLNFEGSDTYADLLSKVRQKTLLAYEHQDYPFDQLVDELDLARDLSRSPLYDAGFTWHSQAVENGPEDTGHLVQQFQSTFKVAKSDIWLHGIDNNGKISFELDYNTDLFSRDFADNLLVHFERLFSMVLIDSNITLDEINILSQSEHDQIVNDFNATVTNYPSESTIQELFEETAANFSSRQAIVFNGQSITYSKLNEKANQLAHFLTEEHRVAPGQVIGIMVERSIDMMTGILAILKAGAAYLPIDPNYPEERIDYLIKDSGISVLLTDSAYMHITGKFELDLFALDVQLSGLTTSVKNPDVDNDARSLAYLMYTSGSTGKPKGVAIEHRSVVRLVRNSDYIQIEQGTRLLQTGALTFDACTFEFWGTLLNGGELHFVSQDTLLNPKSLKKCLIEKKIDMVWFTSSWFNELVDEDISMFKSLKHLLVGGDKLSPHHISQVINKYPELKIINGYGPTENTTFSVCHHIMESNGKDIPIGKPIANSTAYILDQNLDIQPVGVIGELYLGGDGLARGYWKNSELTNEKFISVKINDQKVRLYKTGDKAKWRKDGVLEFFGRMDDQVKIRGHRIEPGEIENILKEHEEIENAIVKAVSSEGIKELVAYYTGRELDDISIRSFLETKLPAHMIPAIIIHMERIPLNVNGKTDYSKLPTPSEFRSKNSAAYVPAETPLQSGLVDIWREQLKAEQVGITDNFFSLGGDSIKGIRVVSAINKALGQSIEVKDIFNHQDIRSLSGYIEEHHNADGKTNKLSAVLKEIDEIKSSILNDAALASKLPSDWEDFFPMSDIQIGMLYHSLLDHSAAMYHDQIFYQIEDEQFDINFFTRAFGELTRKHEILRTSFLFDELQQPIQIVHKFNLKNLDIDLIDISEKSKDEQKGFLKQFMEEDKADPFKINEIGLWRIRVFNLGNNEYGILWIVHHAIIDGWSNASLLTELSNVFTHLKNDDHFMIDGLQSSYKDFVIDQMYYKSSPEFYDYWSDHLSGYERTNLPFHKQVNHSSTDKSVETNRFILDLELTKDLHKLAEQTGSSIKEICLAAYIQMLKLTTNASDITVGIVSNSRPEVEDGDKIAGCFLNTVPFRHVLKNNQKIDEFLPEISASIKKLKSYDKLPLIEILNAIGEETTIGNPIFDVLYNYVDFYITDDTSEDVKVREAITDTQEVVNTDFNLLVSRAGKSIRVKFNYRAGLYSESEVNRFSSYFVRILESYAKRTTLDIRELLSNELTEISGKAKIPYDHEYTLNALFEKQAKLHDQKVALIAENTIFSFRELNEKANQVAHYLRQKFEIQPGDLVGLYLDRSEWVVISMLGIMKAGATYLPLDPENPGNRVKHIINDSEVRVVITESAHLFNLTDHYQGNIVAADLEFEALTTSIDNPELVNLPTDIAYVIYTSGSTGLPKGVKVQHRSMVNLMQGLKDTFQYDAKWRFICSSSVAFDSSFKQILAPLSIGAELHFFKPIKEINTLVDYIRKFEINVMSATPAVWQLIASEMKSAKPLTSLSLITSGGEQLTKKLANELYDLLPHTAIYNVYGPTEATDLTLTYRISGLHENHPPIGKPLPNYQVYIMDADHNTVPNGVKGEICISGNGLAAGYLGDKELTAKKFISHPYKVGGRIYCTGDVGMINENGEVEFFGRNDDQVKIRGFRIELPEIRKALLSNPQVDDAVLTIQEDQSDKQLVAYYVENSRAVLRPSWAEQYVYDDMAYYAMSNDHFRNEQYKKAISEIVKGKVVLEVGPGSEAVLSIMCIECGAEKVYAIEILEESYLKAKKRIESLGLDHKIEVIHGDATTVTLPDKVDCCISEIVGAIGGSQGSAKIINEVRKNLNNPEAMIPSRSVSKIAAVTLPEHEFDYTFDEVGAHYTQKIFEKVDRKFDLRLSLENFNTNNVISTHDIFEDLDYRKENALEHTHKIVLEITESSMLHGALVWLDLFLNDSVEIDTLTNTEQKLWLPIYLPLFPNGLEVTAGDTIEGTVTRKLSKSGMHPDYYIAGKLIRNNEDDIDFEYSSLNEEVAFKSNPFYERVFESNAPKIQKSLSGTTLREYIGQHVPNYMVPTQFVEVEQIPLTVNGKVDYNALPDISEIEFESTVEYVQASSKTEEHLVEIWKDILQREQLGIQDNFFELGGHSLKATQVISRIQKEMNVRIDLRDIFGTPTIQQLAEKIEGLETALHSPLKKIEEKEYYDVSHAQKRFWLMCQTGTEQFVFNSPMVYEFEGGLDVRAFQRAFENIVKRHEILRTIFVTVEGQPKQKVLSFEALGFNVELIDLSENSDSDALIKEKVQQEIQTPFDMEKGPLLRAKVVKRSDSNHLFMFTIHHIVSDAWSMGVIIKELLIGYEAYKKGLNPNLNDLEIQHKDFTTWQNNELEGEQSENHKQFWLNQFSDEIPVLELPTDFPRGDLQGFEGDSVKTILGKELSKGLNKLSQENGASLFMTVLAAVNVLLYKYTGQQNIVTGTNVAGRDHEELEDQIGLFLNTIPLRINIDDDDDFIDLLETVKGVVLNAYDHQVYPFDLIVSNLGIKNERNRSPLFDVEVELINSMNLSKGSHEEDSGFAVKGYDNDYALSKDDLAFRFTEGKDNIALSIQFRTDLFERATIERMQLHLIELLKAIVLDQNQLINDLEYMTQLEKDQLLSAL